MVHRSTHSTLLLATVAVTVAACGGGSDVSNASPRITEVPQQYTTGASAFTLDVGDYLSDREGATLAYAVTSGGGVFAGDVYSNTFDTMGDYTVEFTVTDGEKTSTGSIPVRVTAGNFVVVREDSSGLFLLDSRTDATLRVAASTATPSVATTLTNGRLVYQLANGSGQQLRIYDPLTRTNVRIGGDVPGDATYRAKTSDGKILYTAGTGNDLELAIYNPATGVKRVLSTSALSTVTVVVNSDDLVFYEIGVNGQADVYAYEPSLDESFVVGDAATDEQLQLALPNGGVVFSRLGTSGEEDLFYYKVSSGLLEVGADISGIASFHKVLGGYTTDSKVVFTAESGALRGVYGWNPGNGDTLDVSGTTTGTSPWNSFVAVGAGNEVVFQSATFGSTTESDAFFYDLDTTTNGTLRNSTDVSEVVRVSSDGTTAWAFIRPSGSTSSLLAVSAVASPATVTYAAGSTVSTAVGVVANGDVVAQLGDGTALAVFDVSAGTWGTPITGTDLAYAGDGLAAGDFVYSQTASSQTDLSMWDASATGSVVVSDTTGNDVYQIATADGTILFTRVVAGNSNADLFVWDGSTETRLTSADAAGLLHDHRVLDKYTGTR